MSEVALSVAARFEPDLAGDFDLVERRDLERLLRLLDECARAADVATFRESVLDALARYFGYRDTTFFTGSNLPAIFEDRDPLATGIGLRGLVPYMETFHRDDPFHLIALRAAPGRKAVPLTLESLPKPVRAAHVRYLESFLYPMGIHAKIVVPLPGPTRCGGIGLLGTESGAFGARDVAVATLLSRHLGNLFALFIDRPTRPPSLITRLTPRQAEIAALVARGLTNRDIAAVLSITGDTVKKHLTYAMQTVGCANRTQLALLWLREGPDEAT